MDFNITSIPAGFTGAGKSEFDQAYLRKLYDFGYAVGQTQSAWMKTPPDYEE